MKNIYECTACRLYKNRTKIVNGFGIDNSSIMIVGEAPGREEDETGKPFVGGAGRILSRLLFEANIKREECYITNVVKCRPPNNRTPEPDEIEWCSSLHLREEIEELKPELIVALGNTASEILTGLKNKTHRGFIGTTLSPFKQTPVLITYHPAFLMKQREMFPVVVWDLMKVHNWKKLVAFIGPSKYHINPMYEFLKHKLKEWEDVPVAVDIETSGDKDNEDCGLNPYRDEIIGISLSGEINEAVQLNSNFLNNYWSDLHEFLTKHKKLIFHNGTFDRAFLRRKNIWCNQMSDTQIGMHIIHSSLPKKLDFLRSLYTNFVPYKTKVNYQCNLSQLNCMDTDVTLRVYKEQQKFLQEPKYTRLSERLVRAIDIAMNMRDRGVLIDIPTLALHYVSIEPKRQKLETTFMQNHDVSISSPKQLQELLYNKFGFSSFRGKYSTDEDSLKRMLSSCIGDVPEKEVLKQILEYRSLAKRAETYCEGIYKRLHDDLRLRTEWRPYGTDTGRWASRNPSLQTFPEDMRDIVVASKDKILIAADYNRIEFWIMAILSEDEELLEILKKGIDIHSEALATIEKHYPLTKEAGPVQARLRAKALVFGTPYGRSARSIALEFGVATAVAEKWQEAFFGRFQGLKKYFKKTLPSIFEAKGYVETIYGRRKYPENLPGAMNHMIQSTASDVLLNSLIKLEEKGFNTIICVHDSIYCEEFEEGIEKRFKEFQEILRTSSPELYKEFPITAKKGYNWKEV